MFTLFKNAQVYSTAYLGIKDLLTGGRSILALSDHLEMPPGHQVRVVDCTGCWLVPGLIDSHVHITGGGGEGGPASRMPELQVEMMLDAGVTTVIGCLGTDGVTRTVESVLMKVKTLREQGVSAWMYTGAYQVPPPTITGDVMRDIILFEEIIGVGELAISDHRSSVPSIGELARIAAQARVAGMIGGKAGIVNLHMGDARDPFRPVHEVIKQSQLGYKQFVPTHCNRNHYIFEDAKVYGKKGYVDITTSSYPYYPDEEIKPSTALKLLLESGVPLGHITFTSDACGSLPGFDPETGKLVKLEMGLPSSNLREVRDAVQMEKIPLEQALQPVTSNPADILKLPRKGFIRQGYDADLLLLNQEFEIVKLMANGKMLVG
ncbi:MAG TPA: beta-aspartyl-peptidase [Bacteroidales bacterium]|nr:beta-aspartyl-peptidase [Bacteroidales bacterium]HNS46390.1 beta-aspartyl-peptidase [Bacteroidales bacterium]